MDKTDEAFWRFYQEALAKGWSDDNARRYDSRLVWRNAVAWKEAQDLAAVEMESELPGDMPDDIWESYRQADRKKTTELLRSVVRGVKHGITARIKKGAEKSED